MNKTKWPEDGMDWPQKEEAMEKLLTFEEVCECVVKNQELQERLKPDTKWHPLMKGYVNIVSKEYRRKPKETWEQWTRETCPREGWTRWKTDREMTYRIDAVSNNGANNVTYAQLLKDKEYSLNGIDNWQPCGRRVE